MCTVRGCCDARRIRWYVSDLTIQELIEMMQCRPEEIFHAIVQARGTNDVYGDFSIGYKFKKIQFTELPQSADKVEVKIQQGMYGKLVVVQVDEDLCVELVQFRKKIFVEEIKVRPELSQIVIELRCPQGPFVFDYSVCVMTDRSLNLMKTLKVRGSDTKKVIEKYQIFEIVLNMLKEVQLSDLN